MYPACWRGRLTAGPDGLRGSGSEHCDALLRRDDGSECSGPGPDHFAVAAWCSLRVSGRMARRVKGAGSGTEVGSLLCLTGGTIPSSRPELCTASRASAVKPSPSETARSGLDGASTALDWLGLDGARRRPVSRAGGEHRPSDAGGLGGLCQHRHFDRTAGEDAALPLGCAIGARPGVADDRAGAEGQPDIALRVMRPSRRFKPLEAPRGVKPHQAAK